MIDLSFQKTTLSNGLEVILRRDARLPLVAVNLWYHVGPANETPGLTGFAHLFEHMMFQGSAHVPEEGHFRRLEAAGASHINGTTDFDRTNYMEDLPSNQLELALWLESDRMGFLLDTLDQAKLSNQQDVVRNERRQSVENAPYGLVEEELWHQLFPAGHPYYASVIGSHDDIQAARLADVRDFFRRYYAPNNASLAIVGDIDPARTLALVERWFGPIPRGAAVPPIEVATPPILAERRAVVPDKVELPRVYLAWLTAPIFQPGDAEAAVLARILGGGKASRLYRALVYEQRIAQSVSASQVSLALGSVFQVVATAKPGVEAARLEAAIDAEIARLAAEGPGAEELDAAKTGLESDLVTSLEEIGGFSGVADRLNLYNHHLGDPGRLEWDLARYRAVPAAAVRDLARTALARERRVVVHGVPGEKRIPPEPPTPPVIEKEPRALEPREAWRAQPPEPGPLPAVALPTAGRFVLPNGLTVYLVEQHGLPVVSGQLVLRAGSAADPVERPGLAGFTAAMLDEGTRRHDALALAAELERLGAALSTSSGVDGSSIGWRSLKPQAESVLRLAAEVALEPAFPAADVERVRDHRRTALLQRRDSPFQTAMRVLYAGLYGDTHPYGHLPLGTDESLAEITRDELLGFYRRWYSPRNAALTLAGDLTLAEARELAGQAFGGWSGDAVPTPVPDGGTAVPARILLVDQPGAPQSAVAVFQLGVPRAHPAHEPVSVMNQVLGGLFASRVNLNLRERHGWTYGAFSFLNDNRGPGPFVVGAQVRADATGPAIAEILNEVRAMRESPITADELFLAKESIARSLPAMFETTRSTVGTVGGLHLFDLPADFYAGLPARIASLGEADVLETARAFLRPEEMRVVVVGDRAQVEAQLAPLGLGPVELRDAEARPLPAGA